jgi:hypothetical protein
VQRDEHGQSFTVESRDGYLIGRVKLTSQGWTASTTREGVVGHYASPSEAAQALRDAASAMRDRTRRYG